MNNQSVDDRIDQIYREIAALNRELRQLEARKAQERSQDGALSARLVPLGCGHIWRRDPLRLF